MSHLVGPRFYNRCVPAGRQGQAITLVTQYDIHLLHAIEEQISKRVGPKGGRWLPCLGHSGAADQYRVLPSQHYRKACCSQGYQPWSCICGC